ncbi:MAG: exonuclease domain-containing protein [Patescibacteria group bacterium]|jgi:DNA polymerase III epsilon subunit family exonuclease
MDLIVLDTETTGVEARRDSIIEIAAARVSDGKIVDKFQTLIKPANPLNVTVSVLTGIQPEELETAPDISEVREKLLEFVGDLPIVGHNISFDTDFLKSHGIDPAGHDMDTLDLAITLLPKVPFHSMQYLSKYLDLPNQPSHRAMSDVLATVDLVNALVGLAQNVPVDILKSIRELSAKSDWEWSWIFDENISWLFSTPSVILSGAQQGAVEESRDTRAQRSLDKLGMTINPGFNVYELSPEMPQMATNINFAVNDENAVLVVSNDVFQKTDWTKFGLNPYFGSVLQLDPERFNFLINKSKIKSTEFKLLAKILLTGYPKKPFNPADTYLTKDEFYLWEQKLAPLQFKVADLPQKTVMNFASFYEILDNNSDVLNKKHIYLPQWVEFDEWATNKSAKMFTSLYVNALVASRRDFVHDFVTDNKTADELFKLLNNLGSELNDWWKSVEELWGEQAAGSALEISGLLVADKTGKAVKTKAEMVVTTLNQYLEKVKSFSFANPSAQQRQVEHTTNLLEHLELFAHPGQSVKNYLNGYNDRVILNIVKQPVPNIWQRLVPPISKGGNRIIPPLPEGRIGGEGVKNLSIIIASNGVLVNSKPDFISDIISEPIVVSSRAQSRDLGDSSTPVGMTKGREGSKPITFVSGLPDRNRDDNYQSEIFEYITKKAISPQEKILVVFPNVAMMAEFFEMYKPALTNINLFSQNVAGNVEMLHDKLSALDGFTLLISGTNLPKFLPVVDGLDKTVFLTMPFDIPGSLSSLLAKDRFRNEFADYGLPKAIVKFRTNLAELYSKTNAIWMLDSRLISTDWGQTLPKSLSGFHILKI